MNIRPLIIGCVALVASATLFAQIADPAKKALIADLVTANRILAPEDLGFLDPFGHVSVRDPADPNHYYMARNISAGMVTAADIIEYDLDSNPVGSTRTDNFAERFIHGEIYKVRPDVMAVVHSHTPELVAFSISAVPLKPVFNGGLFIGDGLPNFDIRKFGNGNVIVSSPELGRELAQELGSKGAILMYAHGAVTVESSLVNLMTRSYYLRQNAQIQQQAILLGGAVDYMKPRIRPQVAPAAPRPQARPTLTPNGGGAGPERAWDYWKSRISTK